MAKKKTTADKQIAKAILEAQPKNIKEANNLFQTGSTSGKIKEKESVVKAKSLPVRKSSSGDIEIQAPDKVIADFIKSEENKVSAGKKQSTINEYKRTNNREENLVRQKFGSNVINTESAPKPSMPNAFEIASRRFAQKNDPYSNSPYSGKSYAELTNLRKGIERDMHSGKITQAQAEKEKNTIDMWRVRSASKDELSRMLREAEEYKKHYTGAYNDAQMKQTGYSRGMFSAEIKDANEKRLSNAKGKLGNIETLIGQIKSQQGEYEAQESYDKNLVKWGKIALESGESDKYVPTEKMGTPYDIINTLRADKNGKIDESIPGVSNIKNSVLWHLTDGELKLYNTLHNIDAKEGTKKADEFIKDIEDVLKRRLSNMQTEEAYEYAQKHPILGGARSVVQNVAMGLPAAVDNVVENITGDIDTYDDTSRILRTSQAAREGGAQYFTERFGETGGLLYNTGVSIVENLANVLLFKGAGKAASALISANMATSAASNAMISAADRGGNDRQILMSGVASGLAEYLFEKISIDRLLSPQKVKSIAKNALIQSGVEGSEETFTEIANIISDSLIMQGQSENARKRREYVMQGMSAEEATKKVMQESIVQVAMSAAAGAISGGVMGTGAGVINNMSRNGHMTNVGERLISNPDRLNRILQIGVENGNAEALQMRNEGTDTSSTASGSPSPQGEGFAKKPLTARQAGEMAEGIITDVLTKKGDIASIARIIGALEGRDASYLGSKESFDTARAVLHFANETATKEDTALLERSSGAVTLLTAIEGDTKAWNNVKSEAIKDAEYRASRGFEENMPQMQKEDDGVQSDISLEQTAENVEVNEYNENSVEMQEDIIPQTVKGEENTIPQSPDGDSSLYTREPKAERYDIPENSEIENNIVVDEYSKRVMVEKPRAYGNIIRMARRMGMNVRFVKDLTDENGKALDGLITSKGVFINADAENPSRFVSTHEFGHRMKQAAPKEWAKYQEYVINKLKKESFDGEKTAYNVLYEETRNAYGKDDADYINEEIAVNYAGELFDNEEMLENFIREDKSLALRVRDWWYNVLESMGLLSEKKKAQQMWLRAYTAAAKNIKNGKVGAYSDEKFSIQRIVGEKGDYGIGVYLDSDLLTELTDEERIKAVKEHIKNLGGSELIAYDNDGNPIKIRVAKRSWKYENKNGAEIRANRDLTSYLKNEVKQEAIMLIDELMETAKYKTSEKAKYSHGWLDNNGKNNWDYWKVFIQEKNKTVWEATLNVTNSSNGEKILYDIYPIEMVEGAGTSTTTTTKSIITQDNPSVNTNSMQNTAKNTQEGKKSIAGLSLSEIEARETARSLERENAQLKEQLENLHIQLSQAEGKGLDASSIRKAAQDMRRAYGSKIGVATLHQELTKLYTYMSSDNVSGDEVANRISAIARRVIENATETIDTGEYADLLDTIRNTRIAVPEDDKASFADGYEHFRKRNMGKLKLVKDGYPLDALWDDLVQEYPYLFSEELISSEERLDRILEIRNELLPVEESVYKTDGDFEKAVKALENDIMESFFKIPEGGNGKYVFYDKRAAIAEKTLREREKQFNEAIGRLDREYKHKVEKAEEQRDRYRDRFSKDKLRKNIDRDFRYLYSMFHNPTDNRHIPQELRASVGDLLRCFNFETKRLDGIRNEGKEAESPTAARLNAMADAFEKILRDVYANTAEMEAFTDEYLKEELKELKENIPADDEGEAKRLEDMNIEELQTMEKVLKTIHHIITKGNEAFSSEIRGTISAISDKAMSEMADKRNTRINPEKTDAHKVLNFLNEHLHIDNIKPWEMFNELGGAFAKLYKVMREGFNKHIKNIKEASEVIKDALKDLDKKEITGKGSKKYTFTLESGKNIEISKGQIMCLYALYQRKQGREHILYGGIVTKTIAKTKEGKKQNIENIHAVTQKDLGEMFEKLSREETDAIKKIVEFMSTTCARWGNETSMKLFGYEKYGETWYFPIKVARGTLQRFVGSHGEGNSKNQSFTKGTVPKARNAVEIGDFLDVVANHINGMSVYNALTPILLDVQRVLNYKQEIDGFSPTYLNEEFKKTYGVKVLEYVEKFIADVDGVRKATDKSGAEEKLLSISKKAAIALNIRVFVQQWTSVARALMFLSPADLTMTSAKVSKLKKEMLEEMPIAYWKSSGFRDLHTGGNVKDVLLDNESKWDKLTMGMYGWADDNTLARIYGAVKKEVGRNNPTLERDSAEFKRKVRERFDYVVDRTQVVDSPFHKSQNMRSEKYDKKIVTSFMSEPLTNFNLYRSVIMDAINEGDATKKMARATAVFVVSNLLLAMSQSVPDAWREDDDDELFTEDGEKLSYLSRYLKKTGENLLNNSNPLTYVPYVKEIVSIIDGFSVERMEYSNISKMISAAKKIADEDIPTPKRILNLTAAAAAVFGFPTHTLMRDVTGLYRTIYGAIGEEYAEYAITKLNWDVRKIDNKEKFMKHYKRALQNGHGEVAQLILQDYLASNFKGRDFKNENAAAVTAAMADVYSATKDNRALYSLPENEFKYEGEEITLSEEEYGEYAEKRNSTLWKIAYDFVTSEGYDKLTDKEKAKGFGEIKDYSENVVLQNYIKDYAIPDWQMKLEEGEISYIDRAEENHENNILKELALKMYEKTTSESYTDADYEKDIKRYTDKEKGYEYSRDEIIKAIKNAGRATSEYKKYKSDFNRNFKYDKEGMSDAEIEKMEKLRTEVSGYYADEKFLREGGDKRHLSVYDDELSDTMTLEQYLTHHARAKTTAALVEEKESMKKDEFEEYVKGTSYTMSKDELQTYLNSTSYSTAMKAALFRAIGNKGWKNPYDGTKNP